MKVVFFGTPKEVIPVLEKLKEQYDVVAVVTAPDKKSGRKQLLTHPPVKIAAKDMGIPVIQPSNLSDSVHEIKNLSPDLFVVAAYGEIIPKEILKLPAHGAINIHPSLLPKYRGSTPIQTALLNGDKESGVTFIQMDEKMDHGPILHQIPFTLELTDTFDWLMQSMFGQSAQILPQVISDYIAGKLKPQPQDDKQATFTKLITKEDSFIDLENPPDKEKIDRMIRAYFPWPTVWTKTMINSHEVRIKFLPNKKLQVEGKNPVNLIDFLNGYSDMREKLEKLFI